MTEETKTLTTLKNQSSPQLLWLAETQKQPVNIRILSLICR
jgi:hypothetical protein